MNNIYDGDLHLGDTFYLDDQYNRKKNSIRDMNIIKIINIIILMIKIIKVMNKCHEKNADNFIIISSQQQISSNVRIYSWCALHVDNIATVDRYHQD